MARRLGRLAVLAVVGLLLCAAPGCVGPGLEPPGKASRGGDNSGPEVIETTTDAGASPEFTGAGAAGSGNAAPSVDDDAGLDDDAGSATR